MKTVLLGPQRFRTTVGAVIRTVAPEGTVATVTAGWQDRESDTRELDATLEGRGRHLNLYGRLVDVLDSDPRFAGAALAYRDAVDELAGIYSFRLQRALRLGSACGRRSAEFRVRPALRWVPPAAADRWATMACDGPAGVCVLGRVGG